MNKKSLNIIRVIIFILALFISSILIYLFFEYTGNDETALIDTGPAPPVVSFIHAVPGSYPYLISGFGQVTPDMETTLQATVSGKVVWVSDRLENGIVLKKNELILKIDPALYQSRVADARLALTEARVVLLQEEQEARQALRSWETSGISGPPDSPLVLRHPQLAAAKARLDAASASLTAARKELSYCEIRSPFNGLVVSKTVCPGRLLSPGDPLVSLAGTDKAIVQFNMDAAGWAMLPSDITKARVVLTSEAVNGHWQAKIIRDAKRLLPESRLRPVFCEVSRPLEKATPLLFSSFVTVRIQGRATGQLLKLPESCFTRQGKIWIMSGSNRLEPLNVKTLFYDDGAAFIRAPENQVYPLFVARYPTAAFVKGLKVSPNITPGTVPATDQE